MNDVDHTVTRPARSAENYVTSDGFPRNWDKVQCTLALRFAGISLTSCPSTHPPLFPFLSLSYSQD